MAASKSETASPISRLIDEIAQALEERQSAKSVTIAVADSAATDKRREFQLDGEDIVRVAHALRRAVAREEAI